MKQVLFFSLTAMANPSLLAATTVMLLLPDPKKLMLGFLCGALITSLTLGTLIVFELEDSGAVSTVRHTVSPLADLVIGALLLLIAFVLRTRRHERVVEWRHARAAAKRDSKPPRWRRAIGTGSPWAAFVVGMLLTLPGASYLAALIGIVKLDAGAAQSVLLIVMVNIIMLALLELPLISFAVAPDWTPTAVQRLKDWFARNGLKGAVIGATTVGVLLTVRGLITLA
ncbi:GAP family protein [Candidatus Solirubrobacter pratensis]|uniref:GAP family protein n=1 Tax=Candidatus Solirubrobacter pratensis TaxID=1298857 RepID=UPI0009DC0F7D|nr:GAP family protein [Candidatus Solirubrobacter pratensis]